jgi:hypothetical protein
LENNRNDCAELQKDFNQYSKKSFIFVALEIDSKYENKELRIQREMFLIQQIPEEFRYNRLETPESSRCARFATSRGIRIKGQIYPSLSNAAKLLKEARTNIVRKALNPENLDSMFLTQGENAGLNLKQEYIFHKSCPCIINGIVYQSLSLAA